jgi:hypothetical protein
MTPSTEQIQRATEIALRTHRAVAIVVAWNSNTGRSAVAYRQDACYANNRWYHRVAADGQYTKASGI